MSRILHSKKRFLLGVAASLVVAAAAFAYWTTSGTGGGTSTAGDDQGVTVAGDPDNGIYPGGDVDVKTTITNSSTTQSQHVNNLHVFVKSDTAGCDSDWFSYKEDSEATGAESNPHTFNVDAEIAGGGNTVVDGTVYMSNPDEDQDACQEADIDVVYQANNASAYTP